MSWASPETILYRHEADALRWFDVGRMFEPPIELESIAMANALENSAPVVIGIADPSQRRSLTRYVYNVSGALIGKEMAAALRYPKRNTFGVLPLFRLDIRYKRLMARLFPNYAARMKQNDFTGMLGGVGVRRGGAHLRMARRRLCGTLQPVVGVRCEAMLFDGCPERTYTPRNRLRRGTGLLRSIRKYHNVRNR